MMRLTVLTLLVAMATPAVAAAQPPSSIDDLLRQSRPGPKVLVTDPVIQPEGEATAEDMRYEGRVLDTFREAQNRQGALDGRWQAQTLDGRVLYTFMFIDPNSGAGRVEGAWADPRRAGVTATGYVQEVTRADGETVIVFRQDGDEALTRLAVQSNGDGAWRGSLVEDGATTPVVMIRSEGIETMALDRR